MKSLLLILFMTLSACATPPLPTCEAPLRTQRALALAVTCPQPPADKVLTSAQGSFTDANSATWNLDQYLRALRNGAFVGGVPYPSGNWATSTLLYHQLDKLVYLWGADSQWYYYDDALKLFAAAKVAPVAKNPAPFTPPTVPVVVPPPIADYTPPGTQVAMSPSTFDLSKVGSGNTAVLAAGTYPGFTVPSGVAVYSPVIGAAIVNGTIACNTKCDIVGLVINGGQVDLTGNNGSRVSRNSFKGGFNRGDVFGTGAIYAEGGSNLTVDHNHFETMAGAIVTWSVDNFSVTQNEFVNLSQAISCLFPQAGHGGHKYLNNYFSGLGRMAIECGTGGNNVPYPAFHDVTVTGNYAEKFNWPSSGDMSGNVIYSIVGSNGGSNLTVTGNYGVGTGSNSIGIELNATGLVSGNVIDKQGYSCVEVYGPSNYTVKDNDLTNCGMLSVGNYANGTGSVSNNQMVMTIAKPVTGPLMNLVSKLK